MLVDLMAHQKWAPHTQRAAGHIRSGRQSARRASLLAQRAPTSEVVPRVGVGLFGGVVVARPIVHQKSMHVSCTKIPFIRQAN
jgi:hypothetical protein